MKNKFLIIAICLLMIPISVFAKEGEGAGKGFESNNLVNTLKAEEMDPQFSNYSENDDQITIYMFRGQGCGVCRNFLNYLNSITEEHGYKFKLVSYAITFYGDNHPENTNLVDVVSNYLGQEAGGGVPYIIIGSEVFPGYAADWNDDILNAIDSLYKSEDRYDVFDAMREEGYKFNEDGTIDLPNTSNKGVSSVLVIVWNLIFTTISTIIIVVVMYIQNKKLNMRLDGLKIKGSGKND